MVARVVDGDVEDDDGDALPQGVLRLAGGWGGGGLNGVWGLDDLGGCGGGCQGEAGEIPIPKKDAMSSGAHGVCRE